MQALAGAVMALSVASNIADDWELVADALTVARVNLRMRPRHDRIS